MIKINKYWLVIFICFLGFYTNAQIVVDKIDYCSNLGYGTIHIEFNEQTLGLDNPIELPVEVYWDNRTTNDYGYINIELADQLANGDYVKNFQVPSVGIYEVTLFFNENCEAIETIEVGQYNITMGSPSHIGGPSTCGGSNGGIWFKQGTNLEGGVEPYTGIWHDENGLEIEPYNGWFGRIANLTSGTYYLTITDAIGCSEIFEYTIVGQDEPITFFDIFPACEEVDQGSIYVIAYNTINPTTYTFTWSNGAISTDDDESEILNLAEGNYSVTISDEEGTCEIVKEFYVPLIIPDFPLTLDYSYEHTCPEQMTGSITLNITGGIEPYNVHWADWGVNTPFRVGLESGIYTATITDYCDDVIVQAFDLTAVDGIITATPGCRDEGHMEVSAFGGTPPYTYLWDDGSIGVTSTGLSTGQHTVVITDANGCSINVEKKVQNKEFEIEEIKPCEGFNDGQLTFIIHNPNLEEVSVTYSEVIILPTTNESVQEVTLSNLNSNDTYEVNLIIGNCSYDYSRNLPSEAISLEFEEFEDGVCFYNQLCKGEIVNMSGQTQQPWLDVNNAGGSSFSSCFVPEICNRDGIYREVHRKKFRKKWIRGVEYLQLLALASNSEYHPEYIQQVIDLFFSEGMTPCSRFRFCPANLQMTSSNFAFDGYLGSTFDNECEIAHCNGPFGIPFSVTGCLEDFIPIGNVPISNNFNDCLLRSKNETPPQRKGIHVLYRTVKHEIEHIIIEHENWIDGYYTLPNPLMNPDADGDGYNDAWELLVNLDPVTTAQLQCPAFFDPMIDDSYQSYNSTMLNQGTISINGQTVTATGYNYSSGVEYEECRCRKVSNATSTYNTTLPIPKYDSPIDISDWSFDINIKGKQW